MAREKWQDCLVDGNPILIPDGEVEISRSDLDADDSGRDESGVMHRIPVRYRVKTWALSYAVLSEDEYEYMVSLFDGKATFAFTFRGKQYRTYCSNDSATLINAVTGEYRNFKIKIIEC